MDDIKAKTDIEAIKVSPIFQLLKIFTYATFLIKGVAWFAGSCALIVVWLVMCHNQAVDLRNKIKAQEAIVEMCKTRDADELFAERKKLLKLKVEHCNMVASFPSCLVVSQETMP